ncbi:phosphodiester glycosidase family protein [Streptomyces sp. NPDC004393]|uniref:phosphodiester glycosidase family protein n=1 Tax=Streptomyces sp. NPDC004533 TaxID=3154278 RepID=UPI0033B49964
MRPRGRRLRTVLTTLVAWSALAGAALVGAAPATGAQSTRTVAPGVRYSQFDIPAAHGTAHAHLVTVDLRDPHVRVDLLYPGAVAARATVSRLAGPHGAVAGINGDFFDITETQHPGVEATDSSDGPAIAGGHELKAAVPNGQRFGPALPPGADTQDVLGVGTDRRARLDRLSLSGSVRTPYGRLTLRGLNQYALPVGSIGAYTSDWGTASRMRAVCGTDTDRAAPCSTDTYEVTVRKGRVVATAARPGGGPVSAGTTVLVGREAGARHLRTLYRGEAIQVRQRLVAASSGIPYRFVIGGFPLLRGGVPSAGLDDRTSAVRTAVGIEDGGRRLLLLALDGAAAYRNGLTLAELAATLRRLGATDGFNLDGGGSTTLVTRLEGESAVTVRNHPSGGVERAVANGIGVFSAS